jgi:hypothetical protein
MRIWMLLTLLIPSSSALSQADVPIAEVNRFGKITSVSYGGEELALRAGVRIPLRGWAQSRSVGDAERVSVAEEPTGRRTYSGRIRVQDGQQLAFRQTIWEDEQTVHVAIWCRAESDLDVEGIFYWIDVPMAALVGGRARLSRDGQSAADVLLPRERPDSRHLLMQTGESLELMAPADALRVHVRTDRPYPVVVQDPREFGGGEYDVYLSLHRGPVPRGTVIEAEIQLQVSGTSDTSPVLLTVDAGRPRYQLDGFGGNYCFAIESPVTQYTLDQLHVAWARTEMTLIEWEPDNDNDAPGESDWTRFEAQDRPGSDLRREFELAAQLQQRGIPYCISIWHLPEWMYAQPARPRGTLGRRIADDKWPEVLESIGSYLLYARRQYGVQPDLFSFNEANLGVYVLLSAEEHRDAILRIGRHLEQLGLGTKMLLADATGPRGTHVYASPAASDPEALRLCGAVGFHSWGGGSAEDYQAWADLADRVKLPLLVTELGVDSSAWQDQSFASYAYGMREVQMYQELLLYARPQGTMQWEFTSDYGIVDTRRSSDGTEALEPTARFWFVKHFCNLTPVPALALTTQSSSPKVLLTAFRGPLPDGRQITLHVSNVGAARPVTLRGIPPEVTELRAVRTTAQRGWEVLAPVRISDGEVTVTVESRSLLTLSTWTE